jgi:hypothetical protein
MDLLQIGASACEPAETAARLLRTESMIANILEIETMRSCPNTSDSWPIGPWRIPLIYLIGAG